jgi:uncharacterized protein (TIGR02594 family)
MKVTTCAGIVTSAILVAALSGSALAKPSHLHKVHHVRASVHIANAQSNQSNAVTTAAFNDDLVSMARKYIGTNPTGMKRLWCGAFMDLVLRQTGHKGGSNLALDYLRYGKHVPGPQIGAIAVMGRRGGGHVGVVSGLDPNGNPIIISGNHNRTTAESVYPRGRIFAYVVPES